MSMDRSEWMRRAACVGEDPNLFFDTTYSSTEKKRLQAMCRNCPVLELCRPYAILHEEFGYWAGLTERERGKLRRRQESRNTLGLQAAKEKTLEAHNLLSPVDRKLYQDLSKPPAPRENQILSPSAARLALEMNMALADLDFDLTFEI